MSKLKNESHQLQASYQSAMWKSKASHVSSISKKFSGSLDKTNEGSEEELVMEATEDCFYQNLTDRVDEGRDQLEDNPQEVPDSEAEEESGEDLEEVSEEDVAEEVGRKQIEETILDSKVDKKLGEVLVFPVCSRQSFYNCNDDQTEAPFEEQSEALLSKQTSECENKSGSAKSSEKKRCLNVASGASSPLLCYQSQKKFKKEGSSSPRFQLGPSGVELNNDFAIAMMPIDKCASKGEDTGSSGKQRRSRWEPQPDGDGMKEDTQACKRRKTRWSSDDTQIKLLGPLQLPDFTKDFVIGSEKYPEIQGIKAELFDINKELQRPLHDDRPEEERSPSPEPIYDNLGIRKNTREVRLRQKLVQKRQKLISKLIKLNPTFNPPSDHKPQKLFKKLYIPVKKYPEYNFVGLIIGPRGNTQKRMENETGAKILLRGKGSSKTPNKSTSDKEDLHVYIEAGNQKSHDAAVAMVEKLLIPIEEGMNEHKRAQLKELAMLSRTVMDENVCSVCGDQGHQQYACPNLQSTFNMNLHDTFCSNSRLTPTCPLTVLSPQSNKLGSGLRFTLTQKRQSKPGKEINDTNLYVGCMPQSVDDNRLTELFSPFGKIIEAKVVKDRATGISKGYGFAKLENSMDAAAAVAHLNGFKMDGKFLKVRVAGVPSNTESPGLSCLPQHPGSAATSPNVPSRTDWSDPLHFMLPEHQSSFSDSSGPKVFPYTVNSEHGHLQRGLRFTPPVGTSSRSNTSNSSNMLFSCNFSDQSLFSTGNSVTQFPRDPAYSGYQFQS